MKSRGAEPLLVGLLLASCIGVVIFVFASLGGPGEQFRPSEGADPQPPASVSGPAPSASPAAPPPKDSKPRRSPPPAKVEAQPAEPPPEEEATGPTVGASDPAELTLELLVPREAEERAIRVEVRDSEGRPVDDALVVFRDGPRLLYRDRTDGRGVVAFQPEEFERGPFRIDAIADGYAAATAPKVKPGAETELILEIKPFVEGVVKAPSMGHGIVKLFLRDGVIDRKIAPDGTFLFPDLEEGFVTVQASVPPYGTDSETFYLHPGAGRFVRLRIRKTDTARLLGRIRNWVSGGKAWINGVPVSVLATGSFTFEKAVFGINEMVVDCKDKALLRELFVVSGNAKSQYNFVLRRHGKLRGKVRSARTRKAVAGAEVRIGVEFGDPRNDRVPLFPISMVPVARTDPDGRFEIGRLDIRLNYVLSAVAVGYGQALVEGVVPRGFRAIELPEGPFLYGKLRGLGGVPRGAVITARRLEEVPSSRVFNVQDYDGARSVRNPRGFYGLSGLLPGLYLVRVDAERYGSVETVVDLTEGRRWRVDLRLRRAQDHEERDAYLLRRLPPVVGEGEDAPAPEELPPSLTTSLEVDLRRKENQEPFPSVRVSFFEEDEEVAPKLTFSELEFEILGLPEGRYRAVLTHPLLKKPLVRDGFLVRRGHDNLLRLR